MSGKVTLGQNIKTYRRQRGLSQNELAELLDFSREHLACVETGKEYISLRKLFELADILKIPVKDLFNFE